MGLLPSGVPDCSPATIRFVISSGTLRRFEDPSADRLIALVHVGESVGLFITPSAGTARGCNHAFGPAQDWTSTDNTVASVVPSEPGSEFAALTGLSPGETVISARVIFPLQQPPGPGGRLYPVSLVYYCCGLATCPAAPRTCMETPIDRVRVVPQ